MTTNESIEYLTRCADGLDPEFDCAVLMAISALRAQRQAQKNDPLTPDELREIVGQLESCAYKCEGGPIENNTAFIRLKELAYRHKPEEETE